MTQDPRREIPFGRPILGEAEKAAVAEVLSGHMLTHGPRCAEFEKRFAERVGAKHAVTTSSCTTALHLALLAHGVGPGDEVIVPAETHVATGHVVEHCGARPVFVDVDRATGNIGAAAISEAITARTKAVMPVHYLGLPCDMDAIRAIADPAGLAVIEDCALALGADYGGRHPGAIGAAGCFSFYPAKHITTMEGGMLVTNDDGIEWTVRKQRAFGYDKGLGERSKPGIYDVVMLGYNFRMSEAQAAVGLCQLDRLDGFLAARECNAAALLAGLADIDEVFTFPVELGRARSSHYCVNAVLRTDDALERGAVVEHLKGAGIGTSVHYPVPVPLTAYYRERYGHADADFPVARWISDNAISLPVGPHLDEEDMTVIADSLKEAIAACRH
ncbi:MAG: DegT/DnrJ/EryC1/StrS family aminotransferase [Rhodospirillaceae bacterium]|nr:DegT/DnrJ/EryC1/StrS family aminotransferase [Rhodospirillaceae bacterium]MBT6117641.1 DegT/DnrJ/EryC1/StrS family aminotransferase [Rhodospirillaceae bacterium]